VLCCKSPQTATYRNQQLSDLQLHLKQSRTPSPVIAAIVTSFQDWITPPSGRSRAPTFGSLQGLDILVTSVYYEQFHQLGWFQLCLGHISLKWSRAVAAYSAPIHPTFDVDRWATNVISLM
jgi:hypothetical protein